MESIRDLLEFAKRKWKGEAPVAPEPALAEPSEAQITGALIHVGASSARIHNAHRSLGSTFLVSYNNAQYLVTSAHLTNNSRSKTLDSTGFHYNGKKLFPVVKAGKLALAEHLAFNPLGAPCDGAQNTYIETPFRDLSILRLMSPEETRTALSQLTDADTRKRLSDIYMTPPELGYFSPRRKLSSTQLVGLTEGFGMTAIPLPGPEVIDHLRTPSAFMVSLAHAQPTFARVEASAHPHNTDAVNIAFDCANEVRKGHSGALLFDVTAAGKLQPMGVVTAVSEEQPEAYAVSFDAVIAGLEAVQRSKISQSLEGLRSACTVGSKHTWFSANALKVDTANYTITQVTQPSTPAAKTPAAPERQPVCPR